MYIYIYTYIYQCISHLGTGMNDAHPSLDGYAGIPWGPGALESVDPCGCDRFDMSLF